MDKERIAKRIARAGLASRREAEAWVAEGRVAVNGAVISEPGTVVGPGDRVTVDGAPLPRPEPLRLWLHHKPAGLVTTERDEKGRETVFDALPEEMGRVLSVGRLDLTSEGLLLLTNDGGLKRELELPDTGWMRRYRVRVHGRPTEAALDRLRKGVTVEGPDGPENFAPMTAALDHETGANAWLTVGLREGRNREVRRACEAVGLTVTRLIRVSYGPFQLGDLPVGAVEEVRPKVLRDQLGPAWAERIDDMADETDGQRRGGPKRGGPKGTGPGKGGPKGPRRDGPPRGKGGSGGGRDGKPSRGPRAEGGRPGRAKGGRPERPARGERPDRPRSESGRDERGRADRPGRDDRPPHRADGPKGPRREGAKGPGKPRPGGDRVARDGARSGEGFGGRGKPGGKLGTRPERTERPPRKSGPPMGKPPVTRNDPTEADKPAERTKAEKKKALREDSNVSLRTKRIGSGTRRFKPKPKG